MESILNLFRAIAPLSDGLANYLESVLEPRYVARKETLLREGETARFIYFIEKGLVRSYYYLDSKEINSWFMKEGDIFVSVQSFFFQTPSYETVEAMEESILWGISYQQLQYAYKHFVEFNIHRGVILEKYYALSEQRQFLTKRQSAINRYASLVENDPELLQRVPAKYIASYLGLNEGTLSHIKARYAKQTKRA